MGGGRLGRESSAGICVGADMAEGRQGSPIEAGPIDDEDARSLMGGREDVRLSLLVDLTSSRGRAEGATCACAAASSWSSDTPIAFNVASLGRFGLGGIVGNGLSPPLVDDVPLLLVRLGFAGNLGRLRLVGMAMESGRPFEIAEFVDDESGSATSLEERNQPKLLRPLLRIEDAPDTPAALITLAGRRLSPLRLRRPRPPSVEDRDDVDLLAGPAES